MNNTKQFPSRKIPWKDNPSLFVNTWGGKRDVAMHGLTGRKAVIQEGGGRSGNRTVKIMDKRNYR